jgi:hypothetical protein
MTVDAFGYIIDHNGWWGRGAGTGSQGAQYFGGGSRLVGSAAEGGVGKVLAELGVQGVIVVAWFGAALIFAFWRLLGHLRTLAGQRVPLAIACISFVLANAAVYTIAHQVFGDAFVLLVVGWFVGFSFSAILSTPPRSRYAVAPRFEYSPRARTGT